MIIWKIIIGVLVIGAFITYPWLFVRHARMREFERTLSDNAFLEKWNQIYHGSPAESCEDAKKKLRQDTIVLRVLFVFVLFIVVLSVISWFQEFMRIPY